jgi:bifunctional non-homologous end joining protein LigD
MDLGTARDFQLMAEEYDLSKEKTPPWLHEIKHDGFRAIARKDGVRVKIYSRPGNELTHRFPLLVEALARLRARSCIIDGEAVACGEDGIALFERIRYRRHDESVFMWAFDLIELNGEDLRREQLNSGRRRWCGSLRGQRPACGSTST